MLLKNLIKKSADKRNNLISGIASNSNEVKKIIFFLQLREIKLMAKNLLKMLSKKVHL